LKKKQKVGRRMTGNFEFEDFGFAMGGFEIDRRVY
jgi:hypothetical protein